MPQFKMLIMLALVLKRCDVITTGKRKLITRVHFLHYLRMLFAKKVNVMHCAGRVHHSLSSSELEKIYFFASFKSVLILSTTHWQWALTTLFTSNLCKNMWRSKLFLTAKKFEAVHFGMSDLLDRQMNSQRGNWRFGAKQGDNKKRQC